MGLTPPARPSDRARRGLRRFLRADEGQVSFLTILLVFALVPLLGLVVNAGDATRARLETQDAADRAAFTCAGNVARGYNFLSNCNVALLQLTGLMAMADSVGPTADDGIAVLQWQIAAAAVGGFFSFGATAELIPILQGEIKYLQGVKTGSQSFVALRSGMDVARHVISTAEKAVVNGGLAAASHLLVATQLSDGTTSVFPLPPGGALAGGELLPEFPVDLAPLSVYEEEGLELMRDSAVWKAFLALFSVPLNAGTTWFWHDNTEDEFRQLVAADEPKCTVFWREPWEMDEAHVDRYFRYAWAARREPVRWSLPGFFGAQADLATWSAAEALVFTRDDWDLLTPQWEAALVPVTRVTELRTAMFVLEGATGALDGAGAVAVATLPVHH